MDSTLQEHYRDADEPVAVDGYQNKAYLGGMNDGETNELMCIDSDLIIKPVWIIFFLLNYTMQG